jgi:hypothetical protein
LSALGELAVVELDKAIAALRRIWDDANTGLTAKGSGVRVPPRAAFTPEVLKPWLPNIGIVEVVQDGGAAPRFRVRLAGTAAAAFGGRDLTGKFLDEAAAPGQYDTFVAPYLQAMQTGQPTEDDVVPDLIIGIAGTPLPIRRLVMPCSSEGQAIDRFVVGLFLYRPESN